MIEAFVSWLVHFVESFGYFGIFIMSLLESTFVPVPSEFTLVPAGYLVQQGKMSGLIVFLAAISGTLVGSLLNYWFACKLGRAAILRWGKYFMLDEARLLKVEDFFREYGALSTFTGRLVLGVRHFIAFPAGLGRMPLKPFLLFTALGAAVWSAVLLTVGYLIGSNQELVTHYLLWIKLGIAVAAVIGVFVYVRRHRKQLGLR
jgi:membrane protein DedA with SNARE-associated domain